MKKVLIIIPAYNEELNIEKTVNRVIKYSKKSKNDINYIVINDGSKDNTLQVCLNNNYNVINLINNLGIGGAVQTGYKYADYNDYDVAIQFDGDGQHDEKYIDKLVDEIDKGNDFVIGSRFVSNLSKFRSSGIRRVGIKILSFTVKMCTGHKIYDPTSGSGSLLLRVGKECKVSSYYGQEFNSTTYNLARMNMLLHGVSFKHFDIKNDDTLERPRHLDMKFDAIVANPPYSANWSADPEFIEDERFSAYGKLAPKSKADFAFIQHMIYQLSDNGTMAVVLPHGVLFRGASEGVIRKYLIEEKNYLDAVIGLPANIFYGTSIPTCILVFKKCRENEDNILFIDASKDFEAGKNQNRLRDEDVDKIIETYKNRVEIEKYCHVAPMSEIKENEYNLNIPRYVDTFEEEEEIDIKAVQQDLKDIDKQIAEVDKELNVYLKELGLEEI